MAPGTLGLTGEGSATNAQKLFKNNEDLTVLRVAYTTDGINFYRPAGSATAGSSAVTDDRWQRLYRHQQPVATAIQPSNLNAYGTARYRRSPPRCAWSGSAGSIITNPDGSYGLFLSGAWAADGDSDAFNQIFYATSTDGQDWSVPVDRREYRLHLLGVGRPGHALASGVNAPLGISAYYSGRAYGPRVVQNPDGTLTMIFAGYRLPKPTASAGTVLGTNPSAL